MTKILSDIELQQLEQLMDNGQVFQNQLEEKNNEIILNSHTKTLITEFKANLTEPTKSGFERICVQFENQKTIQNFQYIFAFAIFYEQIDLCQNLFKMYNQHLKIIMIKEHQDFTDDDITEYSENFTFVSRILEGCIRNDMQDIALLIIKQIQWKQLSDNMIFICCEKQCFQFITNLLKDTMNDLKNKTQKEIRKVGASRKSQSANLQQQFKRVQKGANSKKTQIQQQYGQHEYNNALKISLENNQEQLAKFILKYNLLKQEKYDIQYIVLQTAIAHECFYFVKKLYDYYPYFRIKDQESIIKIIELIDHDEMFIHSIFLMSKVQFRLLNQIHVRLIIDKYQSFFKNKLIRFTYTPNPILVTVMICQNLHSISNLFQNMKIKSNILSQQFLKVAINIKKRTEDEIIVKYIYISQFYPASMNLINILYKNREFYEQLLQNPILDTAVKKLYTCEYKYSMNFMSSCSSFKNLQNTISFNQKLIKSNKYENMVIRNKSLVRLSTIQKDDQSETPLIKDQKPNMKQQARNKMSFFTQNDIMQKEQKRIQNTFNFWSPYPFFVTTEFQRDIRFKNHVLSVFFWQKSCLFKNLIEIYFYLIVFFSIYAISEYIDNHYRNITQTQSALKFYFDGWQYAKNGLGISNLSGFTTIFNQYKTNSGLNDAQVLTNLQASEFCNTNWLTAIQPTITDAQTHCKIFLTEFNNFWSYYQILFVLEFYHYCAYFQAVCEITYYYQRSQKFNINMRIVVEQILVIMTIFFHIFTSINFSWENTLYLHDEFEDKYSTLQTNQFIQNFFMWIKILAFFQQSKYFGMIIKVIQNMFKDLANFMIILFLLILAFASIFYNLFDKIDSNYATFPQVLRELFNMLFGEVSFDNVTDNIALYSVLINIYAFFVYILIMNLLVATLTNTFEVINQSSSIEIINILYNNYLTRKPDKYLSILVSFAPPLNIFVMLVSPILLFKQNSQFVSWIRLICFLAYAVIYNIIFYTISLAIFTPLCYIKYIIEIPVYYTIKRNYSLAIGLMIHWIIFGIPFLLFKLHWNDIPLFQRSILNEFPVKDKFDYITLEEIKLIKQCIDNNLQKGRLIMTQLEITKQIEQQISKINKNQRAKSILIHNNEDRKQTFGLLEKFQLKKEEEIHQTQSISTQIQQSMQNKEYIDQHIEIDKLEVQSLLKQFIGVDGTIQLKRFKFLIDTLKFQKKASMIQLNQKKKDQLVNWLQCVTMLDFEESIFSILAEQTKNTKIYKAILQKYVV